MDGDAALKTKQLHGDLSLIVVHGHDAVKLTAARPHKDSVRREWPACGDAQLQGGLNRGADDVNLLAAEQPALTGMGIQTATAMRGEGTPLWRMV